MNNPYREPANANSNSPKMGKEDVGRITAEIFYKDKDDKVVSSILVFTGSYNGSNGYSDGTKGYRFTYAKSGFYSFLHDYCEEGVYALDNLIINRDRMIEIKVKVEEDFVEYPL